MKIKANSPIYDSSNGLTTIKLTSETGAYAQIKIDFLKLLPFANRVSSEVVDFFILATCVYGIDRFVERKTNSIDGWSRELKVDLPVTDVTKWQIAKNELESLFSFLTGDYWEIDFHKTQFAYPDKPLSDNFNVNFSQVNLFSGGLDSLIGAIDFLQSRPNEKIIFTSHYDREMPGPMGDQKELLKRLQDAYKDQFAHVPSVEITLSYSTINKETTFRSRSIIFIGMALLVAQTKNVPIIVPENGTVSLNYPLSPSRRSACSTRTTHPTYMSKISILWAKMGIHTHISNPYEFCTKGEMVSHCENLTLLEQLVELSNSCGKRGHRINWESPSATHCGLCMPCTYRRASLLSINDSTVYGNTINKKWAGKRNTPFLLSNQGQDIAACLEFLRVSISAKDIKDELLIGGVTDLSKIDNYVKVVLRTRDELRNLINNIGDREVKKKAGII
ncbi:MAG: hypothetical protein LBR81_09130 [Prevotellaceae bacterium]|jgi:7-cyano-7-deazaguanine synthase in queuosine biosynthesis|nr:hypothetical protein [Prevotellaceae bacterium]